MISGHETERAASAPADAKWLDWLPGQIRDKVAGRANLQSMLHNTGWLLFDRIYRMGVGMFLGIWMARYLAPSQFGLLSYAISVTGILGAIAPLGLDSILVRELVHNPTRSGVMVATGFLMRLCSGAFVVVLSVIAAFFLEPAAPASRLLIGVIALTYLAQAFDIFDYYFQSRVRSKYSVIAKNMGFTIIAIIKVWLLLSHGPLLAFAALVPAEFFLGGIGMAILFRRAGERLVFRIDPALVKSLFADGWPLALSTIAIMIYMRVDQVLLEKMLGSVSVGVYAAAVRLVEVWYFLPSAITVSVFPSIIKARSENRELYLRRLQQLYNLMAVISLVFAGAISICSGWLMHILYGSDYTGGAPVLTIYAWSGVATFLGVASSQYLTAENLTRISLYRTVIGMILNVILNLLMIPTMGIVGSAIATLLSYTAATFSIALFSAGRMQGTMMLRSLFPFRTLWGSARP